MSQIFDYWVPSVLIRFFCEEGFIIWNHSITEQTLDRAVFYIHFKENWSENFGIFFSNVNDWVKFVNPLNNLSQFTFKGKKYKNFGAVIYSGTSEFFVSKSIFPETYI